MFSEVNKKGSKGKADKQTCAEGEGGTSPTSLSGGYDDVEDLGDR